MEPREWWLFCRIVFVRLVSSASGPFLFYSPELELTSELDARRSFGDVIDVGAGCGAADTDADDDDFGKRNFGAKFSLFAFIFLESFSVADFFFLLFNRK